MRRSVIAITILCLAAWAQAPRRGQSVGDTLRSPEVSPDHHVTFRIYAPKAAEVTLTGDWLGTAPPPKLTKDERGVWSITLGPFEPSIYIYSFNVDGMPIPDPVNPRIKLRARTSASMVEVKDETPAFWEPRDVPHGNVEINWEKSQAIAGETRAIWIYTPPDYAKTARRYPVLYLLHGSNDTAAGWTMAGYANFVLDNLLAERKAVPMIVVMPFGHATPFGVPVPPGGITNDALFEEYLLKDVIPTVEARYRVAPGRENRAIAGLSMGGGQSLKIGLGHLDLFSAVASFSGAVPADFETRFASLLKDANGTNERLKTLWIGCGRQDSLFVRSKDLSDLLTKYQVKHVFYPTDGVHNYTVWRKYLAAYAPLLFREGATSANAAAPEAQSSDGWKLVWSDEFDKDGRPDPAKWTYETGFVRNQELQWYQPENAWCEKGMLIIEGRRERKKNPGFQAGSANWKTNREYAEYTSASLTTKGIASWKYGRFEMRGRIDTRPGLWPAFWSLGVNGFWPSNGEIDIMEYYRGMLLANLIWAGQNRTTSFTKRKLINSFADPEWSSKFHVWRMDWDENRIVISVDGEVLNDSDLNQAANPDGKNGFRQAHSIILNLAIGGTAGGDPSATEFPARFEVDYVRVFQRE